MHVLVRLTSFPFSNAMFVCLLAYESLVLIVFFSFTIVQVVMAVYQMHQAASLDLVSLNVLKQLQFNPFYELFSLQGLDVRFFVLRRSALFTLGDKKRLSAVMSGLNKRTSRNIRLL